MTCSVVECGEESAEFESMITENAPMEGAHDDPLLLAELGAFRERALNLE